MQRRQKTRAPVRRTAARALGPGVEHDEPRQILRLAAEAVGRPRADARPAKLLRAGVHHDLRGRVIEGVRVHGLHDGDVVRDLGEMRQQFGKLRAGLAVLFEFELRPQQRGVRRDERRAVALQQIGRRQFAVVLRQFRFVVEQFEMARPARLEQIDDALGLWFEVRLLRRHRIHRRRSPAALLHQRAERDAPETDAALLQEPATRNRRRVQSAIKM